MEEEINPKEHNIENYRFYLPESQIAQYPVQARCESRLMILNKSDGSIQEDIFKNIATHLPAPSVLILNTTKVFPARLKCTKEETKGKVEFLLLTPPALIKAERIDRDYMQASVLGLIKPAGKVREGQTIRCSANLFIQIVEKFDFGQVRVNLRWSGQLLEILSSIGHIPLPPYIKRPANKVDQERYQTIYASNDKIGSIAAPTAGLHFTSEILTKLENKGIVCAPINLHVGYGTFSPIRESDIKQHRMHSEFFDISEESATVIEKARNNNCPIVAVGTTSVRAIESVMGQFGYIRPYQGWTDLYIYPGYKFKAVNQLITNFHLPGSSLLLMVSAFVGRKNLLSAYKQAIQNKYRFFSYGDVMLIR